MRRILLIVSVLSFCAILTAQRYDYDDIYFNPKKDIKKVVVKEVDIVVNEEPVVQEGSYSDDGMSYTARINMFHRADSDTTQDRLAHIADPNYTTNVFVLTDGQYVVDVNGNNIEITENYNYPYMDWSSYYWNPPYYYGPYYSSSYYWNRSLYGCYGNYGWSVGFYDPYFYGFYNPWYDPFYTPYWGYAGCYDPYWGHHHHHHHHHGYYPHYDNGPHHPKPDWGDYVARGNENERRNVNSSSRLATNVATSSRVTTTPSAVRRASATDVSTSTVRGASTSSNATIVGTSSQSRKTSTSALPARPTTTREVSPKTSTTRSTSSVKSSSTTTRRSTSTVRSTSSSTRSSSTRSSGSGSSGGRSSGSSSSSTRRR